MSDKEPTENYRLPAGLEKRRSTSVGLMSSASMPSAMTSAPKSEQKLSINTTYDKETDGNIFALGEAASHLDNLDELLTGFGFNLKEMLSSDGSGTVTTTRCTIPVSAKNGGQSHHSEAQSTKGSSDDLGAEVAQVGGGGGAVQVSTISKNFPDGRTVHTRIIQGPVKCKRRIVRIMRDGPNGPEVVAEIEAEPDCDVNKAIEAIPASVLLGLGVRGNSSSSPEDDARRNSGGEYDNLKANLCEKEALLRTRRVDGCDPAQPRMTVQRPDLQSKRGVLPNGGFILSTIDEIPRNGSTSSDAGVDTAPSRQSAKRISLHGPSTALNSDYGGSIGGPTGDNPEQDSNSNSLLQARKRVESLTDEDIRPYLSSSRLQVVEEVETESDEEEGNHSLCWSCARLTKGKAMPKTFIELSKGKLCMTASEISGEDDRSLPAPHAVVANYARMLVDNRDQFVQTMFRAVKLNNLDVTKILCKIIQKCGLRLGHHDFRETESSATILHVALLYNHVDIVNFLLDMGDRELILAKYETVEYRNQTSLHVAVANGNADLVQRLILALDLEDRITLVNSLADGYYFRSQHPHGQLCLTAAAWAGCGHVITTLVKYGGNLAMKNLSGNTLLHAIILQSAQHPGRNDYRTLFDSVWESTEIWAEQMSYDTKFAQQRELAKSQMRINLFKELLSIRNNDGYTPLALATTKNSRLFQHLMNLEKIYKIPQNRLGSIAWVTYDVTDVTSFAKSTYNKFSVLHILAHNSQHLSRHANLDELDEDYMEMEPIRTMLTRKWDVYRWIYILWFVVHLFYMVVFTAVTVELNRSGGNHTLLTHLGASPHMPQGLPLINVNKSVGITPSAVPVVSTLQPGSASPDPRHRLAIFIVLPVVYLILELLDLFGSTPYRIQFMTGQSYAKRLLKAAMSEWTITGNGPYRMVSVGFSIFTIYWYLLYIQQSSYQDIGLSMSLLLGWIFVLFFTRGCRVTCRFSIMIQKMFFRDLIYFLTVYGIVLVGFSFAMKAMIELTSISKVFYDMMSVVTDLDQKQTVTGARHPMFAKLLLIFYAIIAVILLMNMLIAMMNTSYETVRVTRCNLWRQQQLSILLMIERRFFWFKWLCRKSERDVWRKDANSTGEERCFLDVTMLHRPTFKCAA